MLVEQAMTTATACCGLNDSLETIAYQMWNGDFGAVPVLNEQGMPVGMITDRDIAMATALRHASPAQLFAHQLIGERPLVSCSPKWELKQALKLMVKEKIRRLPVVDDQYQVIGILTLSDIGHAVGSGRKKTEISPAEFAGAMKMIAGAHRQSARAVAAQVSED